MAPVVHIIDPDPDTLVILRNPCTTLAPWNTEDEQQNPVAPVVKSKKKKKVKKGTESFDFPEPCPPLAPYELAVDSKASPPEDGFGGFAEASSAGETARSQTTHEELVESEEDSIHYHVSSRHLMLASPVFKRALSKNGFAESMRNEIDGLYHIEASDWDPDAFLIVFLILHGRNQQVPRKVDLDMLAKIAILEDYYTFGESLEVFTEMWIRGLTKVSMPTVYCRDMVLWIWVAWMFDKEQQFMEATTIAIKQSTETLRTLDLPIPTVISDEIDHKRYQAINSVVEALDERLESYRSTDYVCPNSDEQSFVCGSFLLGSMTKELSRLDLIYPRPEVPFAGLSFKSICELVQNMQSPIWYSKSGGYSSSHRCTLSAEIGTMIEGVSTAVGGLSLGDLKKRRDS